MEDVLLAGALAIGYAVGAIPASNIVARLAHGPDLRHIGSGMVTPSNVYHAVGLKPALIAGVFDVAKGVVAAVLAATGHPWAAALGGAMAVCGHNWSIFLKGAGGRGLSTATGALAVAAWPGAALMCAALVIGMSVRSIYLTMTVALVVLVPFLAVVNGRAGAVAAAIVAAPIGVKTAILLCRERTASSATRQRDMTGGSG